MLILVPIFIIGYYVIKMLADVPYEMKIKSEMDRIGKGNSEFIKKELNKSFGREVIK